MVLVTIIMIIIIVELVDYNLGLVGIIRVYVFAKFWNSKLYSCVHNLLHSSQLNDWNTIDTVSSKWDWNAEHDI